MITTFIYALVESDTQTVLYIGKSKIPIRRAKYWRASSLSKFGCEIEMILLDHIDHEFESGWEKLEIDWIALFREIHQIWLTNKLPGGNSLPTHALGLGGRNSKGVSRGTSKLKGRVSPFKGTKRPEISIGLNRSSKFISSHQSEEFRNKLKNVKIGKSLTDSHKQSISVSLSGKTNPNVSKAAYEKRLLQTKFGITFKMASTLRKLMLKISNFDDVMHNYDEFSRCLS